LSAVEEYLISPDFSFFDREQLREDRAGGGDIAPDLVTQPHQAPEMSPSVVVEYAVAAAVSKDVRDESRAVLLDMLRPILHWLSTPPSSIAEICACCRCCCLRPVVVGALDTAMTLVCRATKPPPSLPLSLPRISVLSKLLVILLLQL
jgi:hypothetical protein